MWRIVVGDVEIKTDKLGGQLKGSRFVFPDGSYVALPGGIVNLGSGSISTKTLPPDSALPTGEVRYPSGYVTTDQGNSKKIAWLPIVLAIATLIGCLSYFLL